MSTQSWPCYYRWDGEVFRPMPRYRHRIEDELVVDQVYRMVIEEERSERTHRHYFAAIHEAWKNLPEDLAPRFATSEHLRKWSLIKCGFCDEQSVVCETETDARRVMAFAAKMMAKGGEYGVVTHKGNVVSWFSAQSQSTRAMDKKTFQESKQAVLELVADMIGLSAAALSAEVKKQGFHDDPEDEPTKEPDTAPLGSNGHADRELSQVAGDRPVDLDGGKVVLDGAAGLKDSPPAGAVASPATPTAPQAGKSPPAASGKGRRQPAAPSKASVKAAADRAEKRSAATAPKLEPKPAAAPAVPDRAEDCRTVEEYVAYAKAWIDAATKHLASMERFDEESAARRYLKVPIKVGAELQSRIEHKFSGG